MNPARLVLAVRLLATLIVTTGVAAAQDTPYLATIAIERAAGTSGALAASVSSTLHVQNPTRTAASLSRMDGLEVIDTGDDTVRIRAGARPTIGGEPLAPLRQSTWVVDYEEAAIQALVEQIATAQDETPTPGDLEHFVFEHVRNKSYSRSFDLASRVAATGEGDCTEHAVLLAALARAYGYAARVVIGNLILDMDEGLFAFGHAWTEIYDGETWQIVDATVPGSDPELRQVRYIPLGSLTDEGPAYFMSLVETMSSMPARISDVSSP